MNNNHAPKPNVGTPKQIHAEQVKLEHETSDTSPVLEPQNDAPDPNSMHQTSFGAPSVEPPIDDNNSFQDDNA